MLHTQILTGQCILPGCESMREELNDAAREGIFAERGHLLYPELSDDAKEKAREWFFSGWPEHGWWDYCYDTIKEIGLKLGINVYDIHFSLDRESCLTFSGSYAYKPGWRDVVRKEWGKDVFSLRRGDKRYGDIVELFQTFSKQERSIQQKRFYAVEARISSFRSGVSCDVSMADYGNNNTDVTADLDDDVSELIDTFCGWALDSLRAEYAWITSTEYAEDAIIANEYGFSIEGERV